MNRLFSNLAAGLVAVLSSPAQDHRSVHPEIAELVEQVSSERIGQIMKKLEGFGTRDIHSAADDPEKGIGAARRWIAAELRSYSPRLQVRFDAYNVKKQGRIQRDLELVNVIAVLPGRSDPERQILLSGHYDSMVIVRKPGIADGDADSSDWAATASQPLAPGVSDDASGTAAVLEIARVLSQKEWGKTLVFVLFAGEEQGLIGSRLLAGKMKEQNQAIEAVLNNDIIGNNKAGNGEAVTNAVRVFSSEPADSPSRSLARFIEDTGARYVPSMNVQLVARHDRFGRGGDHTPFAQRGFAAVRFTTPSENYANQHTITDTLENASPDYTARVARVNLAAAACLSMAPRMPELTKLAPAGSDRGPVIPQLTRGKSQYDAVLKWTNTSKIEVGAYVVMLRSSMSARWEREIHVGNVQEYTFRDFSIDDAVIGVKAISKDGFESPIAAYLAVERPDKPIELSGGSTN